MARHRTPDDTPGGRRNTERTARGEAPQGRPRSDWPKGLPRKPIEAADNPDEDWDDQ